MVYVPEGILIPGQLTPSDLEITKSDSNFLFSCYSDRRVVIKEFLLSNHEVTNEEYSKFISWVRDSLGESNKIDLLEKKLFYTFYNHGAMDSINITIPINHLMDSVSNGDHHFRYLPDNYHHQVFLNYPIVGISYYQAKAYCHWLTNRTNDILKENNINYRLAYRLPTQYEWQYSLAPSEKALWEPENHVELSQSFQVFSWNFKTTKNIYKEVANYGWVFDQHNQILKQPLDDKYAAMSPIKTYEPNRIGLYDLCGNVSEWTSSEITTDSIISFYRRMYLYSLSKENKVHIKEFMKEKPNYDLLATYKQHKPVGINDIIWFMKDHRKEFKNHNYKVIKDANNAVIVKGGSYLDPLLYLRGESCQAYSKETTSIKIGFRVALEIPTELMEALNLKLSK